MKHITRIVLFYLITIHAVFAETLQIKVDQILIDLPFWHSSLRTNYGGVVLIRGGEQPQSSPLLEDFARLLAARGWSVALLNTSKEVTLPWISQLPEVISLLRQQKNKRIVLIHYGEQLNQSLDYFSKPQSKMINGLIMLSAYDDTVDNTNTGFRFPLFDIAGQFDYDTVLSQMAQRRQEYKKDYSAVELPGTPHDYEYNRTLMLGFIHGWMAKLPETQVQSKPILESYVEPIYSESSVVAIIEGSTWPELTEGAVPD